MGDTPEGGRELGADKVSADQLGTDQLGADPGGLDQRDSGGRDPGRPADRAQPRTQGSRTANQRIGIRELRQHASVYVDLAEKGYTVDITNRGRLVAQLIPARSPGSPLERLIAAGVIEPADEPGGAGGLEPYPSRRAES